LSNPGQHGKFDFFSFAADAYLSIYKDVTKCTDSAELGRSCFKCQILSLDKFGIDSRLRINNIKKKKKKRLSSAVDTLGPRTRRNLIPDSPMRSALHG
jgi:hypothetical protein